MTNDDDYWGATGANLPRVPDARGARPSPDADAADTGGLDATAPMDAVDLPTPPSAQSPATAPPPVVPADEPLDEPVYRSTQRIPRAQAGEPDDPATRADLAPTAALPDATATAPDLTATGDLPTAGATAVGARGPVWRQHQRLALLLTLAVVALGALIVWRLLTPPDTTAVPVRTTTAPIQPAPSPSPAPPPSSIGVTNPDAPPPPLPPADPAPVRTITQTVLVRVPSPTPHPPTVLPSTAPTTPAPPVTPSSAATSPSSSVTTPSPTTPSPSISTAGWHYSATAVGPIQLGMAAPAAAQAGYLVADPAAPEGYRASPALHGLELWVVDEVVTGVVITDVAIRSEHEVGVGTPIHLVGGLEGTALVAITLSDASGASRVLPGLDYADTFVAFVPSAEYVPPTPGASPSTGPGPSTGPSPAETPVVEAIIVAHKPPGSSASPEASLGPTP